SDELAPRGLSNPCDLHHGCFPRSHATLHTASSVRQGQGSSACGGVMAGTIFINYRRHDSTGTAGRLHDRLAQSFGRNNLFMDVDHIPPGVDFVNHLDAQVARCDVFLVVIGPSWLEVSNENGERRLDDPGDFVAREITTALARDIRVIPVLVDGARMPTA